MDSSACGDLENAKATATANELGKGLALAGIIGGVVCTEGLVESLMVGRVRKEFIVGRVVDIEDLRKLGVVEAVVADLVVAFGSGGGSELLTVRLGLAGRRDTT